FDRGDTPQRVRRDLERKLKAAGRAPTRPGMLFSPPGAGQQRGPVTDPFVAHAAAILPDAKSTAKSHILEGRQELAQGNLAAAAYHQRLAAGQRATFGPDEDSPGKLAAEILRRGGRLESPGQPTDLPTARSVTPLPPLDRETPLTPLSSGRAVESSTFLLAARRALAEGDLGRATEMMERAKALGAQYGPSDDSPGKVEALVQGYSDLIAQKAQRGNTEGYRARYAQMLMEQAEGLLRYGDYDKAEHLAALAAQQGVTFGPYQANPRELQRRIADARRQNGSSISQTVHTDTQIVPATGSSFEADRRASHAVYDQANDHTRNRLANNQQPTPAPPSPEGMFPAGPTPGARAGESPFRPELTPYRNGRSDPISEQRFQDRAMLGAAGGRSATPSMIDEATATQRSLYQQVAVDVAHQESEAKAMRQSDPRRALALLEETRSKVEAAGLEPSAQASLLARLDRSLGETERYIEENRPRIELEENALRTKEQIARDQQNKLDGQEKLARMVEEFNHLIDEGRYAEAEVIAKRAAELNPENPLSVQLVTFSRLARHHFSNLDLRAEREEGFMGQMGAVDASAVPFDDRIPIVYPNAREWEALTLGRKKLGERGRRRTERELEIEEKLKTPVMLEFENAPLSQVMDYLARMAAVNLHLDSQGMAEMAVTSEDPVTIQFSQEISLESALNLILEPRHLTYVIKDEVLKITSEDNREGELFREVYNVADLVIPIPNFVPSARMGLAGAYHDAMGSVGFGGQGPFGSLGTPMTVVASRGGGANGMVSPAVLAQMPTGQPGASMATSMPMGYGPGGLGGGAMADFESLIELITTTIAPESWDDVGGPGSIAEFATNLSLVVSQTQDVHEQISSLLEQLRRMQDLQVTIEVRFITLNDSFFERIGIDFDFDIDDDIDRPFQVFGKVVDDGDPEEGEEPVRNTLDVDHDRAVTVGLQQPGVFAADLDIPFTQNSFGLAVPQFGGFDATAGAQLGFAILSDIEAFFFISAAQGDRRSNVLQAPKVTLFNGQLATINDTSQSPFVMSVIPVVGDFAAAQQPVIVILTEGTFLTVQAVVSDDRRYVRLTVVPFFSRIGKVDTFTFEGSTTTTDNTSQQGNQEDPDGDTGSSSGSTRTTSGTTVQLPTFSQVSVTTTVSVPDGGTVLLGGIKRLSEGRNEFGVPMLNKIPYINRLFKNVGIGRETQSLMMMVTPRIIIQEEEEEQLGIVIP
ncbi:MAG: hypothetical protein ABIK89_10365, partial [Planctomycetota bacterium]